MANYTPLKLSEFVNRVREILINSYTFYNDSKYLSDYFSSYGARFCSKMLQFAYANQRKH